MSSKSIHEIRAENNRKVIEATVQSIPGYNTENKRAELTAVYKKASNGASPCYWQLNFAQALSLGLDCVLIAVDGRERSMPFIMPLLLEENKDKQLLVISPINEFKNDLVDDLVKMGLPATRINADTWSATLEKDLETRKYRVLLASPEMCVEHPKFWEMLCNQDFTRCFAAIVIDHAHFISRKGDGYRPKYQKLSQLRSFVHPDIPFLIASATISPSDFLPVIKEAWNLKPSKTFEVNLGNDRPNVALNVSRMDYYDLTALNFVVREARQGKQLERTLVFVNSPEDATEVYDHLVSLVPDQYESQIDFLYPLRGQSTKQNIMSRFRSKEIRVLVATEAGWMGDIQDITRVIQFRLPVSLMTWTERLSCGGRSGQQAVSVLLAEHYD